MKNFDFAPADPVYPPEDAPEGVGQLVGADHADSADDAMAGLQARRDAINDEILRLARIEGARQDVEAALAAVHADEEAIAAGEAAAFSEWAQAPDGPRPSPRYEERQALASRRALAEADLAAVTNGERAVAARRTELVAELRQVADAIFAATVDEITTEAHAANARAHSLAAELVAESEAFESIRLAFLRSRAAYKARNDVPKADAITAGYDAIDRLARPQLTGDSAALQRAVDDVRARLNG